ncbi:MAG: glycoside hydrolase [Planctomycetota bacterium]
MQIRLRERGSVRRAGPAGLARAGLARGVGLAVLAVLAAVSLGWIAGCTAGGGDGLASVEVGDPPVALTAEPGRDRSHTWWFPPGADAYDIPHAGGVRVRADDPELMAWLAAQTPMHLLELPAVGARYGERTLVVLLPWPHYAELVVEPSGPKPPPEADRAEPDALAQTRVGVRITFPKGRDYATPCAVVAVWVGAGELAVAQAFRDWRSSSVDLGAIPPAKPMGQHALENPRMERLFGAVHLYAWGDPLFCRLDVPRRQWKALAADVVKAEPGTTAGDWSAALTAEQRTLFEELGASEWPADYLTREAARVISHRLRDRAWLNQPEDRPLAEVIAANKVALYQAFPGRLNPLETWGNSISPEMLRQIHDAGVERALVLASDLMPDAPVPESALLAKKYGYLLGRYDSYHSVHSPDAAPNSTWDTAQFDRDAYETGRVIRADGSGKPGFKRRGYHFAPSAARRYVEARVNHMMAGTPHAAWFVDCDAAYEYFDDYHPDRNTTRVDDVRARQDRLRWIAQTHGLVVGSEGGSALFADVIRFGHGVDTPYIGHLDPAFRDPDSEHFLGKHWPPEAPTLSFEAVPVPASMLRPYFSPADRVPLYRAALGDEVVTSHHWGFDSLKFSNVATDRALLEAVHGTAPMFHVERSTWPQRKNVIAQRAGFWFELHRRVASTPMVSFECLTDDRLVQRARYLGEGIDVTVTANFRDQAWERFPPRSATAVDAITGETWRLKPEATPER